MQVLAEKRVQTEEESLVWTGASMKIRWYWGLKVVSGERLASSPSALNVDDQQLLKLAQVW